jgi:hypothetical protein
MWRQASDSLDAHSAAATKAKVQRELQCYETEDVAGETSAAEDAHIYDHESAAAVVVSSKLG